MSRTDKTRPWWVRMADTPMLTCTPVHDHRWGPCTLPDEVTMDSASLSRRMSGCYWGATDYFMDHGGGLSGGEEWAFFCREKRRRSRHQVRRRLRAYIAEAESAGQED